MGRSFQFGLLSFVELARDANIHRDASDPSRGVSHLLRHGCGRTNDIGVHRTSRDAHDAENAASQRQGQQFAWREALPPTVIVLGCIGKNNRSGFPVLRPAAQIAFV